MNEFRRNKLIEKLGFAQFNNNTNTTKQTFSDVLDPKVKQELLLIQNVQMSKDFFAEEQLIANYRGQIANLVNSSQAKQIVGYDMSYQHAVSALKASIRNYNLSDYKSVKPITYFTNNINYELKKLLQKETAQKTVRMSSDLSDNKRLIYNAESVLKPMLGRTPTSEEVLNFVKNDMGYGANLNLKKIERIQHYDTKEVSGSTAISQENSDGAEQLTLSEVVGGTQDIGEILAKDSREKMIIDAIREYTDKKEYRRLLIAVFGIGEFKNLGTKGSIPKSCQLTGLSSYNAKKALDEFREFCKKKGII